MIARYDHIQYFTKNEQVPKKIPENRGAGLYKLFRDLLILITGKQSEFPAKFARGTSKW